MLFYYKSTKVQIISLLKLNYELEIRLFTKNEIHITLLREDVVEKKIHILYSYSVIQFRYF